jgi:hypothetical protein
VLIQSVGFNLQSSKDKGDEWEDRRVRYPGTFNQDPFTVGELGGLRVNHDGRRLVPSTFMLDAIF